MYVCSEVTTGRIASWALIHISIKGNCHLYRGAKTSFYQGRLDVLQSREGCFEKASIVCFQEGFISNCNIPVDLSEYWLDGKIVIHFAAILPKLRILLHRHRGESLYHKSEEETKWVQYGYYRIVRKDILLFLNNFIWKNQLYPASSNSRFLFTYMFIIFSTSLRILWDMNFRKVNVHWQWYRQK